MTKIRFQNVPFAHPSVAQALRWAFDHQVPGLGDVNVVLEDLLVDVPAEEHEHEAIEAARERHEHLLEQTRRDIAVETRRAIAEIRDEVTSLTILATEKVTRKTLDSDDQRRLVEEAIGELDFSALASEN